MSNKNWSWKTLAAKPQPVSTGPTSEAGKQTSSRNATKHGCCSTETLVLASESHEEFKSLEHTWFQAYSPLTEIERHLTRQIAHADWFLQRATRTYAGHETALFATTPNPSDWSDDQHKTLARFLRYQTTHTNTVAKRVKALEDHRKNRAAEVARLRGLQQSEEKLALVQTKLEIARKKAEPECSWAEHLENMRQKAIALGYTPPVDTAGQ